MISCLEITDPFYASGLSTAVAGGIRFLGFLSHQYPILVLAMHSL